MARTLITVLFFIGSLLVGYFYSLPAWYEFQAAKNEMTRLDELGKEVDELARVRDELVNSAKTISETRIKDIETAIPPTAGATNLIIHYEYIIGKHGMAMKSINFGERVEVKRSASVFASQPRFAAAATTTTALPKRQKIEAKDIKPLEVKIDVVGTYENYKRLLQTFESNLRIMNVRTSNIKLGDDVSPIWTFSLAFDTYYQP